MQQKELKEEQEAVRRRVVGIATLRRLRKMAKAGRLDTEARKRRGRTLLTVVLIIVAIGLGFLLQHAIFGRIG